MKILTICLVLILHHSAFSQEIRFVDHHWINELKSGTSDTIYVLNFWATWCRTCVEELPEFEKVGEHFKNKKVKILLVSHDLKRQIESHLIPFIKSNKLKSEVVFMNETNPHHWIDNVDMMWSGALPATLVISNRMNFRRFYETELTAKEIIDILDPLIEK